MALSKLNFNSLNLTPVAGKGIGFDSGADDLEASFSGGAMTFIKKLTASSSSDLSFLNGSSDVVFDSTYKEYLFIFNNIHPSVDEPKFTFQVDTGTNTNYNQQITSTQFQDYHTEDGSLTGLGYAGGDDQANGTAFQSLIQNVEADNDNCTSGYLHLFNPSSSVFVKHFMGRFYTQQSSGGQVYANGMYPAGYINTTTAITRIQFKMSSGNIDAGTITLYGIN
jgi:hypothetical protein